MYESEADDAEIRLVDFGFARMKPANRGLRTPCFTLHYAAPEVLRHALKLTNQTAADDYDESCDLWSLGVVLVCVVIDCITNRWWFGIAAMVFGASALQGVPIEQLP